MPSTQRMPTTTRSAVATRLESSAASLFPFRRKVLGEDGDESRRERPLGKQIAREIGDAETEQKSVIDLAGAEQARHGDLADQSGDAAQEDGGRNDAGGANQALVPGVRGFRG